MKPGALWILELFQTLLHILQVIHDMATPNTFRQKEKTLETIT